MSVKQAKRKPMPRSGGEWVEPAPVPPTDPPSYALQTSHTSSSGLEVLHETSGGIILTASGRAIHLSNVEWRELVQYGIARLALEDDRRR